MTLEQEVSPSPSAVVGVDSRVGLYVARIAVFEVGQGEEGIRGVGVRIDSGAAGKGVRMGDDRVHDGAATDSTRGSWRGRNSLDGGHEESRRGSWCRRVRCVSFGEEAT